MVTDSRKHVVVIGAGALGGWTAWRLLEAGCKVTILDRHGPGHVVTSSGGGTRVIRAVYGQGGHYTAMVPQCLEDWRWLGSQSGRELFKPAGVLWMYGDSGEYLNVSKPHLAAANWPLNPIELAEVRAKYPDCDTAGLKGAYEEPEAGVLCARDAVGALLQQCLMAGADYRQIAAKPEVTSEGAMRSVALADGSVLTADAFVFACGPWLGKIFPELLQSLLVVSRQEVCFFKIPDSRRDQDWRALPVWIDFAEEIFYGIPEINGVGLKVATDQRGEAFDPDRDDRVVAPATLGKIRNFLARRFPGLAKASLIGSEVCQYTNTPDGELLLDRHPQWENVWLLGGGSGHAFKLGPVMGRKAADMVLGKTAPEPRWKIEHRLREGKSRTQFEDTDSV